MSEVTLHPVPSLGAVFREQLRAVPLALRWELIIVGAIFGLVTLSALVQIFGEGEAIDFHPEGRLGIALVGFLAGVFLWRREKPFGNPHLWLLPVDRRHGALCKVFAGWLWLMAGVAFVMLWSCALALVSGGQIGVEETRLVAPPGTTMDAIDLTALRQVPWETEAWQWVVPFTGATVAYVLGSAAVLGVRYPGRWLLGLLLLIILITSVGPAEFFIKLMKALLPGGLDLALSGATLWSSVKFNSGDTSETIVWLDMPDAASWAAATAAWLMAGLLLLWLAVSRRGR